MCLIRDKKETEKVAKRLKKRKYIIVWKVVGRNAYDDLRSLYGCHTWGPGWNEAKSGRKGMAYMREGHVNVAIHVFLTRPFTHCSPGPLCVLLRCYAYASDFIAANKGHAAFKKVWVPKAAYLARR